MTGELHHDDNLAVLRDMPSGSVNLIYADPPFCTGRDFGAFDDRWRDGGGADPLIALTRDRHSPAMAGYLAFMLPRLRECRRVLAPDTGSLYLHCDPTASAYLRLALDEIFGAGNCPSTRSFGVIELALRRYPRSTSFARKPMTTILRFSKTRRSHVQRGRSTPFNTCPIQ